VDLSEQQLLDCSAYEQNGCNGGWMIDALDYAMTDGIIAESGYPYMGVYTGHCVKNGGEFKIKSYRSILNQPCSALEAYVLSKGPLSVGVYAVPDWFQYDQGVFNCPIINPGYAVNHAVVIVGYSDAYYFLRNSWGADWGEDGYIRVAKTSNCNVCFWAYLPDL
jgi:hypothetical protein